MARKHFTHPEFVLAFILLLGFGTACFAHSYVVPTYYGYGMVEKYSTWVRPYIVPQNYSNDPYYYGAYPAAYYGTGSNYYYGNGYYGYPGYYGSYGQPTMGVVNISNLNVRSGPGKSGGNVVGSLSRGERVWVYGQSGNWYYFRSMDRPQVWGYAYSSYINLQAAGSYYSYSAVPPAYYMR